ncbi:MAG TPA: rhomboid family intramembrane serine protease [Chloroflexota bacterium]
MINESAQREFLSRAHAGLLAQGGQEFLLAEQSGSTWDGTVLLNVPGAPALFAFAGVPFDVDIAQRMVDEFAHTLAARGLLSGVPLTVVLVFVGSSLDDLTRKTLLKLSPSSFYSNLRPETWVVDLSNHVLSAKRSFRRPEGYDAVREAAEGSPSVGSSPNETSGPQRVQQFQAFYGLMQGERPLVTSTLVAINVCVFLLELSTGALNVATGFTNETTLRNLGMEVPRLVQQGQWWRLITTMFLHGSVEHILFNMASLFAVGSLTERLYGRLRYLAIYFGSGLVASLASVVYWIASGQPEQGALGASGAIFGVAGALMIVRFQRSSLIPDSVRRRITSSVTPLVLISLGLSALIPGVDNIAHIAGLLAGAAIALMVGMRIRLRGHDQTRQTPGGPGNTAAVKGRTL